VLDSLCQKIPIITTKKEEEKKKKPFSLERHLKIPLLSRGLKLQYSKTSCGVSAVHFFVRKTQKPLKIDGMNWRRIIR
jgi:hypothetical protein